MTPDEVVADATVAGVALVPAPTLQRVTAFADLPREQRSTGAATRW